MTIFFQDIPSSHVEKLRNEFGEMYVFVDWISNHTNSILLKDRLQLTLDQLTRSYCSKMDCDKIHDLRELLQHTNSTKDIGNQIKRPDYALLFFGSSKHSGSQELIDFVSSIEKELLEKQGERTLASAKQPIEEELVFLQNAFQLALKELIHEQVVSDNRSIVKKRLSTNRWMLILLAFALGIATTLFLLL